MTEPASTSWDHERYCVALKGEVALFAEAVQGSDPATPVPTCPPWTLAKLIKHVGIVHRWAEHLVRTGASERVPWSAIDANLPAAEADYPAWLGDGADPLTLTLRAAGPDAPVWAWGADHHARWWARRMLAETTVHRADAELAMGVEPRIEPGTAADLIDEFLINRPSVDWDDSLSSMSGTGETLHLHATDGDGEWTITLQPEGFTWSHGHGKGTAAVRGDAGDLLLLVYGRRRPGDARLTVLGESGVVDRWQEIAKLGYG